MREDLVWTQQQGYWVAHDPIAEVFFSFDAIEHYAAQQLSSVKNMGQLLRCLKRQFPSSSFDATWLSVFLSKLRSNNLLLPASIGETKKTLDQQRHIRAQQSLGKLMSPLAIRIPILNPDSLLLKLVWISHVLFSRATFLTFLFISALVSVCVLREYFQNGLGIGTLASIGGERWLVLLAAYLAAKSLHELGHGLACVYRKVSCNELGVMLLCFAPCLYCDTSDAWRLRSKWQRAHIAAAGIYVELLIATFAAILWLFSRDGIVHEISAGVMIVCSLGTLFVNSNPLLRYDGYYILSDLWGIPNLAERSREIANSYIKKWFTGEPLPVHDQEQPDRVLLLLYSFGSSVYRTFILGVILWILWFTLNPIGLGLVAVGIGITVLFSLAAFQIRNLRGLLRTSSAYPLRFLRLVLAFTLFFVILGLIFSWPLRDHVRSRGVTEYTNSQAIYASQDAVLVSFLESGRLISEGETLLKLDSAPARLHLLELDHQHNLTKLQLAQLEQASSVDPLAATQLPVKQQELNRLSEQMTLAAQDYEKLVMQAPFDGFLISESQAPQTASYSNEKSTKSRFVSRTLSQTQINSFVQRGQLLGWFVSYEALAIKTVVESRDTQKLEVGMQALVRWDGTSADALIGTVARISPEPIESTPLQLYGDSELISVRNELGELAPETTHYEVTVEVTSWKNQSNAWRPRLGAPATVQIEIAPKTIARRIQDFIEQNIRLAQNPS